MIPESLDHRPSVINAGSNESEHISQSRVAVLIFVISLSLFSAWCIFAIWQYPDKIRNGEFEDLFGGFNSLFSALAFAGLIYTILQQRDELKLQRQELVETRKELRATSEANQSVARDSQANAILDLYQTFSSNDFSQVRTAAWSVLANCVRHKDYCDFIVSSFFVTEQNRSKLTNSVQQKLREFYPEDMYPDISDVIKADSEDRHRLSTLMNFFNVLALREAPKDVFERCEFFYDWWRPLLWWIADLISEEYAADPLKSKYCHEPKWSDMLIKLDSIYGFPSLPNLEERRKVFMDHPIIKHLGIDAAYLSLAEASIESSQVIQPVKSSADGISNSGGSSLAVEQGNVNDI